MNSTVTRGTRKPAFYMVETMRDGRTRVTVRTNGAVTSRTGGQADVLAWARKQVEMGEEE